MTLLCHLILFHFPHMFEKLLNRDVDNLVVRLNPNSFTLLFADRQAFEVSSVGLIVI